MIFIRTVKELLKLRKEDSYMKHYIIVKFTEGTDVKALV